MRNGVITQLGVLLVLLPASHSSAAGLQGQSGITSIPIPQAIEVLTASNALACEAVLSAYIEPSFRSKRLEASVRPGKDRLAMEVHGQTLRFMMRQSVESGNATPAEFQILRDDAESVVAVGAQAGSVGSTVNSIVLNKRNGLAVWTKSRSSFLLDPEPDVQVLYLSCR